MREASSWRSREQIDWLMTIKSHRESDGSPVRTPAQGRAILAVARDWAWGRKTFAQASAEFLRLGAIEITVTENATGKKLKWVRD